MWGRVRREVRCGGKERADRREWGGEVNEEMKVGAGECRGGVW